METFLRRSIWVIWIDMKSPLNFMILLVYYKNDIHCLKNNINWLLHMHWLELRLNKFNFSTGNSK